MKRVYFGKVMVKGFEKDVYDTLYEWLELAPQDNQQGGVTHAVGRKRNKVLDKMEKAKAADQEYVDLEDGEHETFKNAIEIIRPPFTNRGWLEIQERVIKAKSPPKEGEEDKNDPRKKAPSDDEE